MTIRLPSQFTDIPLANLWEQLKVSNELNDLSSSTDDKRYWDGFYDAIVILLGDLTKRPTIPRDKVLTDIYKDFVMEDILMQTEEEIKRDNGSL